MSHKSLILALLLAVTPCAPLPAQSKKLSPSHPPIGGITMDIVLHQVPPEYPYEARRDRITGRGILLGEVDAKTGIVRSVRMEKSTGSRLLDQAAVSAFRQWRFKPGTIRQFRTPITYTMAN